MRISADLLAEIVEHARRDAPDECCGFVGLKDGVAMTVHPVENTAHSPFRFTIESHELLRVMTEIDDGYGEPGVIYHSHTRSEPYPSQTDINFAANWPGWEWLIVGLASGDEAEVRSYLIEDGTVREVPVE